MEALLGAEPAMLAATADDLASVVDEDFEELAQAEREARDLRLAEEASRVQEATARESRVIDKDGFERDGEVKR